MSRLALAIIAALAALGAAQAQHAHASPYAGCEHWPVNALSSEPIANLRAGCSISLALPAKHNRYPGPVHVFELGDQLRQTKEQRTRMQELHGAMQAGATPLGECLITQEADLDRQFATKSISPVSLQAVTAEIGATPGALRLSHLCDHLSTLDVLILLQESRKLAYG